jgi:hypothetical protein
MRNRKRRAGEGAWMVVAAIGLASCGGPSPGDPVSGGVTPRQGADQGSAEDGDQGMQPVRLGEVDGERSDPAPERRNPFRFGPVATDTQPFDFRTPVPVEVPDRDEDPRGPVVDTTAPSEEPSLSFLGFVESPGIKGRIVVLTDGDFVFYGREGEVIDGQYRIVDTGLALGAFRAGCGSRRGSLL